MAHNVGSLILSPGVWNSNLIDDIYIPVDSEVIKTISISLTRQNDELFWHYAKNRLFSIFSGYNLLLDINQVGPFSRFMSKW